MFACIYGSSVSESAFVEAPANAVPPLVELAFTFSPLVEQATPDTVVLDISGQDLLFGSPSLSAESATNEISAARKLGCV